MTQAHYDRFRAIPRLILMIPHRSELNSYSVGIREITQINSDSFCAIPNSAWMSPYPPLPPPLCPNMIYALDCKSFTYEIFRSKKALGCVAMKSWRLLLHMTLIISLEWLRTFSLTWARPDIDKEWTQ